MAAGGGGEGERPPLPGLKEEDFSRALFGEEMMDSADDGGGPAAERAAFDEAFRGGGNENGSGMPGRLETGLDGVVQSEVVETSLLGTTGLSGEHVGDDATETSAGATAAPNGSCDQEEAEASAEVTESGRDVTLSDDPSVPREQLHDKQPSPSIVCASYGQGQMVDTGHVSDTVNSSQDGAAQGLSCSKAIDEAGHVPKLSRKLGKGSKKKRAPKCKPARSGRIAVSSKRTLNRDLPDQLEAHAHRLLKDAGWSITPRKRNDRPKMAYYFAAPQREVVVISLSQAWKFCGQRLHKTSGGSERGKFPMEWSDVDPFWKDLVNTMAYVRKMTSNGDNSLTLLRRWQLLDPFVAVIFIDKRITTLQKQKTLRVVDSSTSVVDDAENRSSENKSTLPSPRSGYSQVASDGSNGHQDTENCHHLSSSQNRLEVAVHKENHIQSNNEPGKIYSGATLSNNLVKRVRKKCKWISDFESTGLNGFYARSFIQPTIGSKEPGVCSASSISKKHTKAKSILTKLNGEKRDLSLPSEREGLSDSGADKFVTIKKQQSRPLKKSSVRGLSEDVVAVSNDSNVVKLSHKRNATVLECDMPLEAQSRKKFAIERKPECWGKHAKKRPSVMHYNDDDLLITAIVKNKDISCCHNSASRLVSSNAMFRKLKSPKRGSRLLIQTAGKGGTNLLDGRQIILARKTVLCWLIATGFMTLKDVVQCRNPKNNEILKDGWVTWDGILCNCCIKTLSISEFKAHTDSSLPKSSLNLCLQSGKSFTLCQLEAWTAEYMDRRNNACIRKVEEVDENDDTCGFCGDGGELLCCDNCLSTYHQACLSTKELPEDSWYCHNCICRSCGCPVSEKEVTSFSATLKCVQCGAVYHDTCIEMETMAFEDMGSDTWFCGRYCKEIFVGLRGSVGVKNFLGEGLSWTILKCNSGGQQLHSVQKIAHMVECNTKLAVALTLMEECFARMVDTRTGIDMIPHVLYNQGSKYARLDYQGFYTVILEKNEEILCAACIRVHGTKAAELPFIATCAEYRRQGMCRRLINTIEEMVRYFHVKMLVLSAIPELVSTWVSGFGFKPIEEDERKQLDTINLMLFPGTSLLTKSLVDDTDAIKSGEGKDGYDVSRLPVGNCMPNGRGSELYEQHDLDLLESNTEKVAVSLRKSKDECKPAACQHSAKVAKLHTYREASCHCGLLLIQFLAELEDNGSVAKQSLWLNLPLQLEISKAAVAKENPV